MNKLLITILTFFLLASCQESQSSDDSNTGIFEKLSKEDFSKKMDVKSDMILVDVRTPQEFQNGTIKGAQNINFYDKNFDSEISKLDRTKPVFIFCKSGGRSGKTLDKMKSLDFKEVYDLKGGYSGWEK